MASVIDSFKEQVGLDNITEEELLSFAVSQKRKVRKKKKKNFFFLIK
jgi:DNA-binding protein H-NS